MQRFWQVYNAPAGSNRPPETRYVVASDIRGARTLLRSLDTELQSQGLFPADHIEETSLVSKDVIATHLKHEPRIKITKHTQVREPINRRIWSADLHR